MQKEKSANDRARLTRPVTLRFSLAGPLLIALLFLPTATWNYWKAWFYIAQLLILTSLVVFFLEKNEPELLERRMRAKESEARQRSIITWPYPIFLATFLLPALELRFGWSAVPW